ncbi:helix-turn-helix domain-containing protein [Streptomyces sp. ME02-8801-2C]|uniref:helix-turn-helix domain-containing protein n=1 Tax=Streptomyces sp. ME02-8801-2C TaxID=3028680 RepID=UPI0029B8F788|nr:helix-turn-helix domain-containing protein [Streptomyces sp. ME02-8801-2C]MDX3454009.1 helix-turn-helix domain-containing protein [Streptomyces sp. ME02-8801-2C]
MSIRDEVEEVEEFAALLRVLKDRTDRSYGSLARRVHMNTSTLHRYCAGEAVPQDFAPVERLAAFCEATPEERLELHRLWLSAVAARQRVSSAGSARAAIPAQAQAPAPDADGALVEESNPAEQPGGDPDPDEPAPSPAPRPWFRRRRVLAPTAVACALLATLGSVSALSGDRSSEADTSAPAVPHRSANSSATVAPSPARNSTAPSPLAWSTDSVVWDKGCDHDYVIDKSPARVPPPPVEQDAGAWAATQGAVRGRQTRVQISVQGRSSTAVVLTALHVRVVARGTPAVGSAYAMDQGCGSDLRPRRFTVNLDADRPTARPKDGADSEHTIPAVHFPYRVSAEDPEVLLVDATTQAYDARWYLELDWSSQGRTGTIRIDDHGRPFQTTSIKGMPHYWYGTNNAGERAWVPYDS